MENPENVILSYRYVPLARPHIYDEVYIRSLGFNE